MIWEHLWDEHDESVSNVVDVYIRYLRNKIDKDFSPPLILTRWGEGYMLRGEEPAEESSENGAKT
jgi:DNA-binding response OmpR family regulator